jgi:hypothetical protein
MSTSPLLPFVKRKEHRRKLRSHRPDFKWSKRCRVVLRLQDLENRLLPSAFSVLDSFSGGSLSDSTVNSGGTAVNNAQGIFVNDATESPRYNDSGLDTNLRSGPVGEGFADPNQLAETRNVSIVYNDIKNQPTGTPGEIRIQTSAGILDYASGSHQNGTLDLEYDNLSEATHFVPATGTVTMRFTDVEGPAETVLHVQLFINGISVSTQNASPSTADQTLTWDASAFLGQQINSVKFEFTNDANVLGYDYDVSQIDVAVKAQPTLVSTAGSAVTLGTTAPTLTDSVVLSGGSSPTGTITFTLSGPEGVSFTQTESVSRNGTYTAAIALPTTGAVAGTYQWSASYSGDSDNNGTTDQGGTAEQTTVTQASPSLVTTAGRSFTLGTTAPTLGDSAELSGGFFETGTITFILKGPGGFSYTQADAVHGNGIYTAGDTLPTTGLVPGTYTWSAHYSGDANNVSANDQGGTAEQTIVSAAHSTLLTTAKGSVTLGTNAQILTDSAVLSGGFFETGIIIFTLTGPGDFSYTQTDTVLGNGTYTASAALHTSGLVAGSYIWSARYSGDANNNGADDQGGTAEQTIVRAASPTLATTASSAVALVSSAPTLSDSAVLSGGFFEKGLITFTLSGPGGFSYTQTETVNGKGTYTAGVTLPTTGLVAGVYHWSASYSGDSNNNGTTDQGGPAEETTVSRASPRLFTTASPSFTLGATPPTLSDSAVLSGGFFEQGTITFTLSGPGGFSYTQTDRVSGDGTYNAAVTLPITEAVAGTYHWSVSYSGDSNNSGTTDQGGPAEEITVSQASPSLVTTASPSSTSGATAPTLSDSAVLSGGFFATGTITFTLSGPGGFSYTQTDTVSGDGTYNAAVRLPNTGIAAGTYAWSVVYSGDANNLSASELGGVNELTVLGFVSSQLSLGGPPLVMAGAPYNLTVTVNESATDTLTSLTVNWDDGTTQTIALPSTQAGSFTLSHEYASGPAFHMISATFAGQDGLHAANTVPVVVLVPGLSEFATAISTPGDPGTASLTGQIQGTLSLPPGLALGNLGLLLVGTYSGDPETQAPSGKVVQFFDIEAELHVTGDPGEATLTVLFSVPDGSDPAHLVPQFFDGTTWRPISGATITVIVDANGHQFVELTLSRHTFPTIGQLGGTVFTVAVTTSSTTNTVIFPPQVSAAPAEVIEPNFAAPATFVTSSQLTLTLAASPESAGSSGGSDEAPPQGEGDLLRSLQWLVSPESSKGSDEETLPGEADLLRSLQWLQGQEESDRLKGASAPAKNNGASPAPSKPPSHGPTDQPPASEPGHVIRLPLPDNRLLLPTARASLNIVLADRSQDEFELASAMACAGPQTPVAQTADSQLMMAALAIGTLARQWSTDEEERRPHQ